MINKCFCLFILCSIITNSKTTKNKARSSNKTGLLSLKNLNTDIGYIQPISLGSSKLNISTLIDNFQPKEQRHKLSFYVSERDQKDQKEESMEEVTVQEKREESEEERDLREREQDDNVNNDNVDDDRGQGDEEAEEEDDDGEVDSMMRNSPAADDDLFYDFDDEELRVSLRK